VTHFFRWIKEKMSRQPIHHTAVPSYSRLDRFIAWADPTRAAEREMARFSIKQIEKAQRNTGYRETSPSPRDDIPSARGASPDWTLEMGFDRRNMVDVARQLERVNSIAGSVLDRACEHVIGEGFTLKCKTTDEKWNRDTEEAWRDWCRTKADSRGMMSFNEMLTVAFRSVLRDGDCAFVLEHDGSMRLVESDEIASKIGGYTRPTDADGVELDRRGRIKAFHIFDYDPTILWPDRRRAIPRLVRVPAENVIFLARRLRAGQTRGISAFAGAAWIFQSADDCLESVAIAHHMAASVGWIVAKKNPLGSTGPGGNEIKMGPGKIIRLEPGEEISQLQPDNPSGTFDVLMNFLTRIGAARFGVSLELVNYDFTAANYSNMRAQSLETAIACRIKQRGMLSHACTQAFAWWIANEIREGRRPARKDAHRHVWGVSGTPWQDPEVEIRAAHGAVDGCFDTRRRILAAHGLDFDEVLDELSDEDKKIKAKRPGFDVIRAALTRDYVDPAKQVKPGEGRPKPNAERNRNGHGGRLPQFLG
jgi:lambda family phage portal protein